MRSERLIVRGIGELLTMVPVAGDALGRIHDAALVIAGGAVAWTGREADLPAVRSGGAELDAGGALVSPGLVEPHAHPIFAGSRAEEFDLRARGESYAAIQARGGGILSTVRATRAAADEELVRLTCARLDRLLAHGVTVCEAKTGYALDPGGELRLVELLHAAGERHPIDLSITLLAHVPAPGAERDRCVDDFCRLIDSAVDGAGAAARPRRAVEAVDVFCDRGAFTLDETRRILEAAKARGLGLRVHAEQLSHTGAARLAAELGARSVEHLEYLAAEDIPLLARSGTVCNLLPGAALTLRLPFPDARRLLDGGCEVALGTDLNPGSSLTESLPLMMSLACMQMGMGCAEAWRAVTVSAARSVGRADAGRLSPGARGDLVVWDAGDHREVVQHYGVPLVKKVVIGGDLVYPQSP